MTTYPEIARAALAEPHTRYRCAMCKCMGTREEMRRIPGTRTILCSECWDWFRGAGERRAMCEEDQ